MYISINTVTLWLNRWRRAWCPRMDQPMGHYNIHVHLLWRSNGAQFAWVICMQYTCMSPKRDQKNVASSKVSMPWVVSLVASMASSVTGFCEAIDNPITQAGHDQAWWGLVKCHKLHQWAPKSICVLFPNFPKDPESKLYHSKIINRMADTIFWQKVLR